MAFFQFLMGSNPMGALLAFLIVLVFIMFLMLLVLVDLPKGNVEMIREMMIALIAALGVAYGYYLGSSDSSAKKNELLAAKTNPGPPAGPAAASPG